MTLLLADDAPPVRIINPGGKSRFLLIGDHAGNRIPAAMNDLGVGAEDRARHIGWDIGIAALGETLAGLIDAPFIAQTYSRLVIDCNRDPGRPDAMLEMSDGTPVPGNIGLSADDRAERIAAIHTPYQAAITDALTTRADRATILVALHSFTPTMQGVDRPWHVGILHDRGDTRFATALLAALRREGDLVIGDNAPYRMDLIDYTIPRHAYPAALPYAEIEIRQDLLADPAGIAAWSVRLARILSELDTSFDAPSTPTV